MRFPPVKRTTSCFSGVCIAVVGRTLTALLIVLVAPIATAAGVPNFVGNWARADGSVRIDIEPCGAKICATNTWVRDTNSGEAVGDTLVMTLTPQSDSVLSGEAFDHKRNKTYAMRITLQQASRMTTHGCVFAGLICKSEDWTRIQ
jgi:uncharacterized protein (DUF2147 family)